MGQDGNKMEKALEKKLVKEALEARKRSYAPYSHYQVGAALLTWEGRIYQGGNVENASYGACCCAERNAIFRAVNEGERKFLAIAVAGGMEGEAPREYAFPCGICRQVMKEFADEDFLILVAKSEDDYKSYSLGELLPYGFGGSSII